MRKNKRYSIINGAYSMIMNTYSSFLALYAIHILHANHQQVGLLNSLPAVVSLVTTIVGGYWFSQLELKKRFCGFSILFARITLLLFALIPYIPIYQAWILVILVGFMNIPASLANLSWQSLMGDLIPEKDRGNFFSYRNQILTIVGMIATAIVGVLLNLFDKNNPVPYQVLFIITFIFGVLEAYYLFKHIELKEFSSKGTVEKDSLIEQMKKIGQTKPFLFFLFSSILFNFGWQMAWPLFNIYQIEYVHASAFWLSLFTVANQLSQILTYKWWGRMSDRFGNSMMLFVASAGMATVPFLTVLSKNLYYLVLTNFWSGVYLSGTTLLLFNQLLAVSPEKGRSSYITLYTIFIGFVGFIAPQFGIRMLSIYGMNGTMNLSALIRLLGGVAFILVAIYVEQQIDISR
ncbi:MFS transporter [Tepidibacillus sp. LV47]|uniref:MFS transporter n=1 Tax=Tepidibacillus sp. LV47 TaxID=3398228 RepID=UPI003AAEBB86